MNVKIRLCINASDIEKAETENIRMRAAGCVPNPVPAAEYIFNPCILDINDVSLPYLDEKGNISFWHIRSADWIVIEYDDKLWDILENKDRGHKVKGLK